MYLLVLFGDARTWQNIVVCRELIESTQTKPSKNVKMATGENKYFYNLDKILSMWAALEE